MRGRNSSEGQRGHTGRHRCGRGHRKASSGRSRRRLLRWIGLGAVLLVLLGAATGWWVYSKLDGNISEDTSAAAELRRYDKERPAHLAGARRTSC